MSIGEPHSAKLARERLEAIKKYLPVRDSVKQQLQSRQESQVEFTEGTEKLFKPIVEPTKKIVTATEATQRALATLPADIVDLIPAAQPQPRRPRTNIIDKFTPEGIAAIRDPNQVFDIAAFGYYERKKYVKPEYVKSLSSTNWIKDVYRISTGIPEVRSNEEIRNFNRFDEIVNKYIEEVEQGKRSSLPPQQSEPPSPQRSQRLQQKLQQREQERQEIMKRLQSPRQPIEEEEEEFQDAPGATGSGLGSGLITCPNNVLADVDRLEILIGGKRAGNNSSEIINEAADICKRLFTGGIMDMNVYRSLINEIADDYHSD